MEIHTLPWAQTVPSFLEVKSGGIAQLVRCGDFSLIVLPCDASWASPVVQKQIDITLSQP